LPCRAVRLVATRATRVGSARGGTVPTLEREEPHRGFVCRHEGAGAGGCAAFTG